MKLRLQFDKELNEFYIEQKFNTWFSFWEHIPGPIIHTTGKNSGEPVLSSFDGGFFYKSRENAIKGMNKIMNNYKTQNEHKDTSTFELDSNTWK